MRAVATLCVALALGGCAEQQRSMGRAIWGPPASESPARLAADDAKCRKLGFTPGTEGYGNCRLQLEQIHATEAAASVRQ